MSMKFLSAYHLLESQGFKIEKKVNESTGEIDVVASVYIKHNTVKEADMRTKAGRRVYYMNARAFGINNKSKKERIQEAIKVAKEHGYRIVNEDKMGGSTVGMFHKNVPEVNHAWTWIDVEGIRESLKGTGITVSEQHGQANVTKYWDEDPVPGTPGVDGPYGEGSSSVMYFVITSERRWMIKFTGTREAFEEANVYPEDEEFETLEEIICDSIPAYAEAGKPKHDDEYKVDITFKAR